jgi:hypothetical protein
MARPDGAYLMPTDNDIDYGQYTRTELSEALGSIDAQRYPKNHQHLLAELASRDAGNTPEIPPQRPRRIARLLELRREVTGSIGTKVIYGASGAFYLCLPLFIIWGFPGTVQRVWAVVMTAMIWVVAATFLFGFCVTYKFESGVVKCLWFGRRVIWEDRLDTLQNIKSDFTAGLPTIYFKWPDHKRRLWLRASDLDFAKSV